jgi:F-box/leucine-rich repeat protein 2/20
MAGVVRSDMVSNNKINYARLVEAINFNSSEQHKVVNDVLASISSLTIGLNKSINDDDILTLLDEGSLFKQQIAQNKQLNLNLESYSLITDKAISALAQACKGLRKISLKSCVLISDFAVSEIAQNCLDLEEIDLGWCDISEKSLFILGQYSKNLVKIGVRSCYITDRSVAFLLQNCPKLKALGLAWCKSLTDLTIESIIEQRLNLETLDIRGNEKISGKALTNLFSVINSFKTLHLKRCSGVTKEVILELSKSAKALQKLNLRGCYKDNNISNDDIVKLFESCPNLESLDIAWHEYLSAESIMQLANHCKKLNSIDLSGCQLINNESMIYLAENCPNLKKIILFNNPEISLGAIEMLQARGIDIKQY